MSTSVTGLGVGFESNNFEGLSVTVITVICFVETSLTGNGFFEGGVEGLYVG